MPPSAMTLSMRRPTTETPSKSWCSSDFATTPDGGGGGTDETVRHDSASLSSSFAEVEKNTLGEVMANLIRKTLRVFHLIRGRGKPYLCEKWAFYGQDGQEA